MASLHVRNVPEGLHGRLRSLARARRRSLSTEVVTLLDDAVRMEEGKASQARVLERIRRRREARTATGPGVLAALRQDRRR